MCYKCGKNLTTEQSLKYHISRKYPCDSKELKCECGHLFPSRLDLRVHKISCLNDCKMPIIKTVS